MIYLKYEFSKLLLDSDRCYVLNLIPYCTIYDIVHLCTIIWVLTLDIHLKICVPPNIDLICGLV